MSRIEDLVDRSVEYIDSIDRGALTESLTLGTESYKSLSDIKTNLVKVTKLSDGSTIFVTNEDSNVSVYIYRESGALKINSIKIDSGIQTLRNSEADIILVSSTGQQYSLIDSNLKVSKAKPVINPSISAIDNTNLNLAS